MLRWQWPLSFAFWPKASDFSVFLMSLAGSFAVTLLVFGFLQFSKMGMNPLQLILAGVAISSFFYCYQPSTYPIL